MPAAPVARLEALRVGSLEPFHPSHQIRFRCLQQQMGVVVYEDVTMHPHPAASAHLREGRQKHLPIRLIDKDRLPPDPPAHHMVNGTFILNANLARYLRTSPLSRQNINCVLRTCTD